MKIKITQDEQSNQNRYAPLPVGRQALRFTACDYTSSKAGNPMYVWKLEGLDHRGDVIHYLTVSEKTQFAWVAAVNAAYANNTPAEIDVSDCDKIKDMFLGRVVDGDITHTEWNGKVQVKIQRMFPHISDEHGHESADRYRPRS